MWKFLGLGALFQIVLLVSLLDVYVYNDPTPLCSSNPYDCPSYLLIFEVNGLETNGFEESMRSDERTVEDETNHVVDGSAANNSTFNDQNASFIAMPGLDEYAVNYWSSDIVPCPLANMSKLTNSSNSVWPVLCESHSFRIHLASSRNGTVVRSMVDRIYDLAKNQSTGNNVFFITSSANNNSQHDEDFMIWSDDYSMRRFNKTPTLNETFKIVTNFAEALTLQTGNYRLQKLAIPRYFVEGNLLDFFRIDSTELVRYSFGRRDYVHLNGLETINTVFSIFNFLKIEIDTVVVVVVYLMFMSWILLLTATFLKDSNDDRLPSCTFDAVNVIFLITLFCIFDFFAYMNYPMRYYVYYFAGTSVVRMLFENGSSIKILLYNALNNKTSALFAAASIYATVESLFWCLWCDSTIVLFVLLIGVNVVHGFLYRGKFKTEIALSVSACFTGISFLLPSMELNRLFVLNVACLFWISGTFMSLLCFMSKMQIDWFLSVLSISEHIAAAILQNWYRLLPISKHKIFCLTSLFVVLSALLPLFGEPKSKFRIPQIGIASASFYLFVSSEREVLVLFAIFSTALCLCFRETVTEKRENSKFESFQYLTQLLHVVVILMAARLVAPIGGDFLIELTSQYVNLGLSSDLLPVVLFYFIKLAFAVNMFEATFLASYSTERKFPALLLVILMFNLVSLRSVVHLSLFPQTVDKKGLLTIHMLTQTLAAMLLYFYPFVSLQCQGSFFQLCRRKEPSLPSRITAVPIQHHRR